MITVQTVGDCLFAGAQVVTSPARPRQSRLPRRLCRSCPFMRWSQLFSSFRPCAGIQRSDVRQIEKPFSRGLGWLDSCEVDCALSLPLIRTASRSRRSQTDLRNTSDVRIADSRHAAIRNAACCLRPRGDSRVRCRRGPGSTSGTPSASVRSVRIPPSAPGLRHWPLRPWRRSAG